MDRQRPCQTSRDFKLPMKNFGLSREVDMTRYDVWISDELFLTGTAAEVIPVVKIDGRGIGEGSPGKITNMLLKEFQALTHKDGVRYTL